MSPYWRLFIGMRVEKEMMLGVHALVRVHAPSPTKPLPGVNSERIGARNAVTRELTEIFLRGSASGELKYVAYPTRALA
ncbi:MAG: hypothetical protein QW432_03755 [Desulfurococcaceae archaeon]